MANQALWLNEKQSPVMVVADAPYPTPGPEEIVIETKVLAINPADPLIQRSGILVHKFPAILGEDVAGVVKEVGANAPYQPGDHVITQGTPLGDYKYAAFQKYVVGKIESVAKIPKDVAFTDAAVLPTAVSTSTSCLFPKRMLGLELPPGKNRGTLLIWGASSSIGSVGVQLAVAAGYKVIGVASERNRGFVESLGATFFDRNASTDEIAAAMKDGVGAYNAIVADETFPRICEILHKAGGRQFVASVRLGAEELATHGVQVKSNLSEVGQDDGGVGAKIWKFVESACAEGKIQYKPNAEVVGHGLQDVQKACDMLMDTSVSAKKLVVVL